MPSTKEYLSYILDSLSHIEDITYKKMMGEYLIYYNCKYIAGVFDNRLLVKDVKGIEEIKDEYNLVSPYPNAKKMIEIDKIEDKEYIKKIFNFLYETLP